MAASLAGCGRPAPIREGGPDLPTAFGPPDRPFLGCAPVDGVYAWPPLAGEADEGRLARAMGPPLPILMPTALPLYGNAQLWLAQGDGLELRSRLVNRDPHRRIASLTRDWSLDTLDDIACEGGRWSWTAPPADEAHPRARVEADRSAPGDSIRFGIVFQPMADGTLALGQWEHRRFRASGRRGPPDAGESRLDPPDRVVWRWSLLERLGDTGAGLPPEDAAQAPR